MTRLLTNTFYLKSIICKNITDSNMVVREIVQNLKLNILSDIS